MTLFATAAVLLVLQNAPQPPKASIEGLVVRVGFPANVNAKWSMNDERCNWPISNFPATAFIVHGPFDIYICGKDP